MNALQKIAVAVLLVAFSLGGCASFDANRPFPEQPNVSESIRVELAGKEMTGLPLRVSEKIQYYDIGRIRETAAKNIAAGKDKVIIFTRDFPKKPSPSDVEIATGEIFLKAVKEKLSDKFSVVGQECSQCLQVSFDFARYEKKFKDEGKTLKYWYSKPTIWYRGQKILVAREDRLTWSVVNSLEPREIMSSGVAGTMAKGVVEEILQAWEKFFPPLAKK